MRYCRPKRRFPPRPFLVHMDPLAVLRRLGKRTDPLLGDLKPLRDGNLLPHVLFQPLWCVQHHTHSDTFSSGKCLVTTDFSHPKTCRSQSPSRPAVPHRRANPRFPRTMKIQSAAGATAPPCILL